METKLETSALEIQKLRQEVGTLKDKQLGENTNQQAHTLLGQMVEKLTHLVDQQTVFFGKIVPKLPEQQPMRPILTQKYEYVKVRTAGDKSHVVEFNQQGKSLVNQVGRSTTSDTSASYKPKLSSISGDTCRGGAGCANRGPRDKQNG